MHVPDKFNAADFLTKWVSAKKVRESVAYTSNEQAKSKGTATEETNQMELIMLEASMAENVNIMKLRSGREIAKMQPRKEPSSPSLFDAYLAVGMPAEAPIEDLFVDMPSGPYPVEGYPYIEHPLGAGYLNAGMPPATPPPADAQAESPAYSDSEMEVEEEEEDDWGAMEPEVSALELDLAVEGSSLALSLANLNVVLAHHGLEAITIPGHEIIPRATRFLLEHNGLPQDHKPMFAADWERYTLTEDDTPHVPRGIFNPKDDIAGPYAEDPSSTDSWDALLAEYAKTAPEEFAFDFKAFSDNMANLAEHIADLGMYGTFGSFANGTVRLYFGYPPLAAVDDMTAHEIERAHVLQDNWVGRNDLTLLQLTDVLVHETNIAVELKEARRTAGLVTKYTTAVHRKIKKSQALTRDHPERRPNDAGGKVRDPCRDLLGVRTRRRARSDRAPGQIGVGKRRPQPPGQGIRLGCRSAQPRI